MSLENRGLSLPDRSSGITDAKSKSRLFSGVVDRIRRSSRRDRDARTETILSLIAGVQAETAQVPGAVGRLAQIVDAIRTTPPDGAAIENEFGDVNHQATLKTTAEYDLGEQHSVKIERRTSYDHHPSFGRVPPGRDELTVDVLLIPSQREQVSHELVVDDTEIREVGIRIWPDAGQGWLIHGRYQNKGWDGHPGTQYEWELLDENTANAFLDSVFGSPISDLQPGNN